MSWLDALLGKIRSGGVDIPLSKGINFANGLQAVLNQTTKVVDVSTVPSAPDAAVFAPLLRGVGLVVDGGSKLRPVARPARAEIVERFYCGNQTSGSIGELGWYLLGVGTPAYSKSSSNMGSGGLRGTVSTSGATNDRSTLCLGFTESTTVLQPSALDVWQIGVRLEATATNRMFVGFTDNFANSPAATADCIGILYDSAVSPNWQTVARIASVGTPVITSFAAVAGTPFMLTAVRNTATGSVALYAGSTLLGTITSSQFTQSGMLNVGYSQTTLAASSASYRVGGAWFRSVDLGGIYDDDFPILEV